MAKPSAKFVSSVVVVQTHAADFWESAAALTKVGLLSCGLWQTAASTPRLAQTRQIFGARVIFPKISAAIIYAPFSLFPSACTHLTLLKGRSNFSMQSSMENARLNAPMIPGFLSGSCVSTAALT